MSDEELFERRRRIQKHILLFGMTAYALVMFGILWLAWAL